MDMLKLAIKSGLPLIHVTTQDSINVEEVLSHIAGEPTRPWKLPEVIVKLDSLTPPSGRVLYTSVECKSLVRLYHFCVEHELTVVFINTEKSVLQFDGGELVPPRELVHQFLSEIVDDADAILPAFGGLTLKDVSEVAQMTMTRDESLTVRGVNETRRGYRNLQGIQQVDTNLSFYKTPPQLEKWLEGNASFFMKPVHASLTPRGLLFDGPAGTGKTLAAKHIAATFGIPLYRLDIAAMKGKYVGESEGNLMAALSQVDQVEPCVVIFDEVEKLFQSSGDSGVTTSLLSQLLWWLQEHKTKVFSVMTTNNKEVIPPELYREGRVDEVMNFLGVDSQEEGLEFTMGALVSMLEEVAPDQTFDLSETKVQLGKTMKTLYAGQSAVPQAKLTQEAYSIVKALLTPKEDV